METLINLILWWVTLKSIVSDSQPDLEKKKKYINMPFADLHSKKQSETSKQNKDNNNNSADGS